jgi:hypothetical protein
MKLSRLSCLLLTASLLASITGRSQTAVTSLHGTITDQTGAVLPGAHVAITDPETGAKAERVTDARGSYDFEQISPGKYTILVQAAGFSSKKEMNVELLVNQATTANVPLSVSAASTETIEVVDTASTLNTSDATIGTPFDSVQIQALPFEGNNVLDLLSLQAGVLFLGDKTTSAQDSDSRSGAVDGARSDQSNVTLDGLDDNDQNKGYAFSGVLRSTRDSVEEFRVVTTNSNADAGRSSGAQVSLVTRSGTNSYHGSVYEYYRPTNTVANDWFNKQAEGSSGEPNIAPKYLRNTFGGSFGAPIRKDDLFYFVAYEGQRTAEDQQVTQEVPMAGFRAGNLTYVSADGTTTLDSAQIRSMDPNCSGNGTCPLGPGVNPAAEAYYAQLPSPNGQQLSDGYNLASYTFASPAPQSLNTLIAKLDYNIRDKHRLFARANLQEDHTSSAVQFPGQPSNYRLIDNSKGIAAGDVWTITNSLVNNIRYGLVRQGYADQGSTNGNFVQFQNIATLAGTGFTSQIVSVPAHNFADDLTWIKGKHTLQFGGNYRLIFNNRSSDATLFNSATVTYELLAVGAIANTSVSGQPPASLDPAGFGYPAVASSYSSAYNTAVANITGLITSASEYYNNSYSNGQLTALPAGEWVSHHYLTNEVEYYGQDSWKLRPTLTVTFGLRHTLQQAPYERDGQEVAPTVNMGQWFSARADAASQGNVVQPAFGFAQAGRANGKPGFWNMDKLNFSPRFAIAYSPDTKTTVRAGFGVYYDHFGQGVVDSFDQQGEFGLVTADRAPVGQYVDTTPRFSSPTTVPTSIIPPITVTGPTPVTPGDDLALAWGVDQSLKTPYSYVFNLSVQRQLGRSNMIEGTYTGRLGRRLLQMRDIATPLDLRDPQSGSDYFAAATALDKLSDAGTDVSNVAPIPYWENMFPWIASGGLTATQVAYENFAPFRGNESSALFVLDAIPDYLTPDNDLYRYFDPQYSSLYVWSSMGSSSYHGLQLAVHHQATHGLQFDAYYTLSKSIDLGSDAERAGPTATTNGGYFSQIINTYNPRGNRGVSDFDVRHAITGNVVDAVPFGRGKLIGNNVNRLTDLFIGGWNLTGLTHWTSGLPFGSIDGLGWGTDWADQSWNVATGPIASGGHSHDSGGQPNAFKSQATAIANLRPPYPGEAGERNFYRGDGYFSVDTGLNKTFSLTERHQLKFAWETFNATNTVRFDPATISNNPYGNPGSYGRYTTLLTQGRRMQLSLRYGF